MLLHLKVIPIASIYKGNTDSDNAVRNISSTVPKSVRRVERVLRGDGGVGRWKRLLNDTDDARVWRVINWSGDINMTGYRDSLCFTDQDFKTHSEAVLNPTDQTEHGRDNLIIDVAIPVLDESTRPLSCTNRPGK